MIGIIYLILAMLAGKEIADLFLPSQNTGKTGYNNVWVILPASFGSGILMMTWGVYLISWITGVCVGKETPLLYGNLVVMCAAAAILMLLYRFRRKNQQPGEWKRGLVSDRSLFQKESAVFGILCFFLFWIMFYVFFVHKGSLYSGFTVYGDYAPHTAMIRSFSWGNNFPTQYPHFGGEDVKYHFMFQFLTGNLEYLGLRIDFAYNIVSVFSLLGFLMILYQLTKRVTGSFACGAVGILLFFFRSGTAFFQFIWEHVREGDLGKTLAENTSFIGYTTNENWGLWNFNVYLNQRHLAFGLMLAGIALWVYMDWLEAGCSHEEKGFSWIRSRLFTKEAWKSRNTETALMIGMILGLNSFWNGAAVIGGLLILFGFAAFSDGKLDYAVTAVTAVALSFIQSKIFIHGSAVSPSFYFGFLAERKDLLGVIIFLFRMSGIFFLGMALILFFLKRRERCIAASFLLPTVFAFCASLTPDITVNHKYIMISYAFLVMFWAWGICRLFQRRLPGKILAVILSVCLMITGVYDFVIILKNNGNGHRISVDLESDLTRWISENLTKDDLLLTPEYSMNEVTMSGEMLYMGWPYYAWSAGYDTYYRADKAVEIYTTEDEQVLRDTVKEEKITYILFEDGMEYEQHPCREELIERTYSMVYESEDGRIRIYET